MPPTPAITPSASRSRIAPAGRVLLTTPANQPKKPSIASIGIVARLKMAQNSPVMIAAKVATPSTGWVKARSSRSVRASCLRTSAVHAFAYTASAHSSMSPGVSGPAAIFARASAGSTSSTPRRVLPEASTTGQPKAASNFSGSILMPRRAAASVMVTMTMVGRPSAITSPARRRLRGTLVASTTMATASGWPVGKPLIAILSLGSPARMPLQMRDSLVSRPRP